MDVHTVETLARLGFAASFPQPVLEALSALAAPLHAEAGEVLFREGGVNRTFYVVVRGQVALEMSAPASGSTPLLTLGPGDILAWSALLGGETMTATATCRAPTDLISIDGQQLKALCEADHELGYLVMRQLAQALSKRLLATRLQLLDLFQTSGGAT
jgi:CRP-like cAMP-binding protein